MSTDETQAQPPGPPNDYDLFGGDLDSLDRRYEILRLIGRGGMGSVVHARDRSLDREVALKVIHGHFGDQSESFNLFLREARAAARMKHPNLVILYDIFEGDAGNRRPFLSMEFIEGISLHELVNRDGPLPVWQAREFVRQAAIGLQHIHENGLVHRDIKPANLMVTARDHVLKILDLGIALLTPRNLRSVSPVPMPPSVTPTPAPVPPAPPTAPAPAVVGPQSGLHSIQVANDLTGGIVGTPLYMSPEQWHSSQVDTRADIYSLGCTFYVLLTGSPPFPSDDLHRLRHGHLHDDPPPIEDLRPDVPRALAAVIRKMLAKSPLERYQTPDEFIRALDRSSQPPPPPTPGALTTADQFTNVLKNERLLTAKQLDAIDTELLPKFPDLSTFAAELVARGWLTAFQMDEILKGRGKELAVGGYVLRDKLGEGGFGIVYTARQLLQNRDVAIKVMRPEMSRNVEAIARFRREIRAASMLSHPNVATVFTADEEGDRLYLVMELCAGQNLEAVVKARHPVPAHEVCEWVRQTAAGLQHIHDKNLLHRDLKPSNLMLTPSGIKILDLGLTRMISTDAAGTSMNLTTFGIGTPHYASPEMFQNAPNIDGRSDLYNLGATMYHLLAGCQPFYQEPAPLLVVAHLMKLPPPITGHRPDVPAGVAAVVHKLMAKSPADRYQTPAELLAAIDALPK